MTIHELTRTECVAILSRKTLARLACAVDDQPYVVPISFYFDDTDTCLYSFSTVGQKINWMRTNPKVCVEVEDITDRFNWTTIVLTGTYEEIRDASEAERKLARALELFQDRPQWWLPASAKLATGEERDVAIVYRIRIDRVSGRRARR